MKKELDRKKPLESKPSHKILTGSTTHKFPIMLEDGKTIVFIDDKSKEGETRLKYKLLGVNRSF